MREPMPRPPDCNAALVLAEKLWSRGRHVSRMVGIAAIAGGLFLIVRHFGA